MDKTGRFFVAMILAGATVAFAQQTRPAARVEDLATTPRGALRALNQAMRAGDGASIRQLLLATNVAEASMVDADAEMAVAFARLRAASVQTYGPQGADVITGDGETGESDSAQRINNADITVAGDVATVVYRDEKNSPFVLKKVDGLWKIPVSQLGKPLDPSALEQRLADLTIQRKVVDEMTAEIRRKQFPTAEEAREAWRARILQAATSQPTTRAAGQ